MTPRLHLALDNCVFSKRWTQPLEWMQIAQDVGITFIEASADTECDPLYTPPDALAAWIDAVRSASAKTGVRVVNLYSGHGSYATLGLAHTDPRVRDHIQRRWLMPMIRSAAALGAGLGFYCHAFPQSVLQSPERYAEAMDDLTRRLAELALFAAECGLSALSLEQMYTPHQVPWTIDSAGELMRAVFAPAGARLYLTLDTGHQVGQRRYLRPTQEQIELRDESAWYGYADLALSPDDLHAYIDAHSYLFAEPQDGDLYHWLRALGAHAPILHLQQTDGFASAHRHFTEAHNQHGIVKPAQVFAALREAYAQPADPTLPPPCADIFLTLEPFGSTLDRPQDILRDLAESAAFWRGALPADGMTLEQLDI